MKFYLSLILCLLCSLSLFAQASEDDNIVIAKTGADRMRDVKACRVLVEKFSDQYKSMGFDENKINSFVSEKLNDNNCLDVNTDPYLYININPIQIDEKTLAASVHISLNRPVYYPAENKTFISMATLWQTGSLITFPVDGVDYVYDILGKLMDKFIIEWYKSQIPYKGEVEAQKEEIKQEPKKEGMAPDEKSLKRRGQKVA